MARKGKVNIKELDAFITKVEDFVTSDEIDKFIESCAKELASRLLAKVIKRTPVGDYRTEIELVAKRDSKNHKKGEKYKKKINTSGKLGGTLRRGWTSKTHDEAASGSGMGKDATQYANSLPIKRAGDMFQIEIINPVWYAPYVEYGHRQQKGRFVPAIGKKLKKTWVEGKHMLKISEDELRNDAPRVLENKLKKKLGELMK